MTTPRTCLARLVAVALVPAALATAACATDTGLLIEIENLDVAKAAGGNTVHLFVGSDLGARDASLVADTGVDPFPLDGSPTITILLRPDGPLDEIGALQFAAAVTSDASVREVAFAVAESRVSFADGELRRVTLTPSAQHFAVSSDDTCVTWASDPQRPLDHAIGLRDDADCDTIADDIDCGKFDPTNRDTHPVGDPAACEACPTAGEPERCDLVDQNCDGRPAPPLPCAVLSPPSECALGVRACDAGTGRYGECIVTDPLPSRDLLCDLLGSLDACVTEPDPIGCAAQDTHKCRVSLPAATCQVERLMLTHAPVASCEWRILGGVNHDQWVVGFQDNGAGLPAARSTQCATTLVARMADPDPDPSPRTVVIVGQFSDVAAPIVELVTLDRGGDCDGAIECEPPGPFPPTTMNRDQPTPASASLAPTITGSIIAAPVPSP